MIGWLFRTAVLLALVVASAILFEFRLGNDELRIRYRFAKPKVEQKLERAREEIPEASRRKLKAIIEENSR